MLEYFGIPRGRRAIGASMCCFQADSRNRRKWMSDYHDRQFPRIKVIATADVNSEEMLLFHKIENLSLGGICIQVPEQIPAGDQVEVVINLEEDTDEISTKAEVVWATDGPEVRIGLRFLDMSEGDKEKLRNYLYKNDLV